MPSETSGCHVPLGDNPNTEMRRSTSSACIAVHADARIVSSSVPLRAGSTKHEGGHQRTVYLEMVGAKKPS